MDSLAGTQEVTMTRPSHPKFVVHCVLSRESMGCAEEGRIFDTCVTGIMPTTLQSLIIGDYLTLKLGIPEHRRSVSVKLARVTWVRGGRFGVEILIMDADEHIRLAPFVDQHRPLELEFHDTRSTLIITAAE